MVKAFISYCHDDDNKRKQLHEYLETSSIEPIVVASRKEPSVSLSKKVIKALEEADYLIPILTKKSINNQWVNQEIGFAYRLQKENNLKVCPIVEKSIMNDLKGFIHKQLDLPFSFESENETNNFNQACKNLIDYLSKQTPLIKNNFQIEVSISHLFLRQLDMEKIYHLGASLNFENKGSKSLLLKDIELIIPFKHYNFNHELENELVFNIEQYIENGKRSELKHSPASIKPGDIKQFPKITFKSQYGIYINSFGLKDISDWREIFTKEIKKLKDVDAYIILLDGEKIKFKIPIYS